MHSSTVYMSSEPDTAGRFALSPETSEWLFASSFWQRANAELGTVFDQYEEEEACPTVLCSFLPLLEKVVAEVRSLDRSRIEFVRGWDAKGAALKAHVARSALLAELMRLQEFVSTACAQGKTLVFEL